MKKIPLFLPEEKSMVVAAKLSISAALFFGMLGMNLSIVNYETATAEIASRTQTLGCVVM